MKAKNGFWGEVLEWLLILLWLYLFFRWIPYASF